MLPSPPTIQLPGCQCRMSQGSHFPWPRSAHHISGLSRVLCGCPYVSRTGHKAQRRVQQPCGSRDTVAAAWLGTAPKIAWGFPFLVCREQGSSMGAGTRLLLFAIQGGGGKEAAGKVSNPARRSGLWQGQAAQEPPSLLPRDEETKVLPLGRVYMRIVRGHLLHLATSHSSCHLMPGMCPGHRVL